MIAPPDSPTVKLYCVFRCAKCKHIWHDDAPTSADILHCHWCGSTELQALVTRKPTQPAQGSAKDPK